MQIYLPIAERSVDFFLILGLGGSVGLLSGLFGVGGGFLMTPILMFVGVPAPVAVATQTNQIIASSVSGVFAHLGRGNVDLKMGLVLLLGGMGGSSFGVWLFGALRRFGQIDLVITFLYITLLGIIGTLMLVEGLIALRRRGRTTIRRKLHRHGWIHGLPLKMRFRRSRLYVSALLPFTIGLGVGVLVAIMGVGGGFFMVPAMIYLLSMPTAVAIGTSLFQIIFVATNVTFLQAYANQTVDVLLALVLLAGSVVGAQVGAKIGARLGGEQLRVLLAALVLLVCGKLAFDLSVTPADLYSMGTVP